MRSRFTQCEKVEPQMASIDVLDGSTKASRLQFSQASGPRKLTSDGSLRYSSPDELKLPSGFLEWMVALVADLILNLGQCWAAFEDI